MERKRVFLYADSCL